LPIATAIIAPATHAALIAISRHVHFWLIGRLQRERRERQ